SVSARIHECGLHLSPRRWRFEPPVFIEVTLDKGQVAERGSPFEVDRRTAADEIPRGLGLAVREGAGNYRVRMAGRRWLIHPRAWIEQQFEQRNLHARLLRMNTRRCQTKRGRSAGVGVGFSVYVSTGIEQDPGDLENVGRSLLAEVLHAVG